MTDMTADPAPVPLPPAKPYLDRIKKAQKRFQHWQDKCARIEKLYANFEQMAGVEGDREFQMFWANMEVLRPTIYSRPPVPVCVPRHRDGGELPRKASELLERVLSYDVEADDLHESLRLVRDDMALAARGQMWVLDNASAMHVDREDFVHGPARKWSEVPWVARRAWLDREALVERFPNANVDDVKFDEHKDKDDDKDAEGEKKAAVWEFWDERTGMVCWVADGPAEVLEESPPMFDVAGFFPCPRPAYATLEPRSLKPVPDWVYYRDQLDEINELTARISGLAESLRLKGFYASGADVGQAVETALAQTDDKAVLVPVASAAALGAGAMKDASVWLPMAEVAASIVSAVELRRQIIDDVYQITGLSDIMRGATDPDETLGAQNLKAQFGSVRVRERQAEMVRIARDVIRIKAEIFAEQRPAQELALIAQMQLPTMQQVQAQMMQAQQQAAMAMQQGQEPPPPPDMSKVVTIEQVDQLLKAQRVRPFVLDVETDSTIAPNEEAEKQARTEFVTAVGTFLGNAAAVVQAQPQAAPLMGELLKFTAGAFRAGRELGGVIDEFVEQAKQAAAQPKPPSPEEQKMALEQQKAQLDAQKMQMDMAKAQADAATAMEQARADLAKTLAEIQKIIADTERIRSQPAEPAQPQGMQ